MEVCEWKNSLFLSYYFAPFSFRPFRVKHKKWELEVDLPFQAMGGVVDISKPLLCVLFFSLSLFVCLLREAGVASIDCRQVEEKEEERGGCPAAAPTLITSLKAAPVLALYWATGRRSLKILYFLARRKKEQWRVMNLLQTCATILQSKRTLCIPSSDENNGQRERFQAIPPTRPTTNTKKEENKIDTQQARNLLIFFAGSEEINQGVHG